MSDSAVSSRLRQAFYDAFAEIGKFMEIDILKAFDGEFGYDESGNKVTWSELSTSYAYERGSAHPILVVDGDLRSAIKVRVDKAKMSTTVTSQKMKERGGPGQISVADISESLGVDRPHTNPSSAWRPGSPNIDKIIKKHLTFAYNELRREGLW